jgi:hypothetical protein
MSSSFVLQSVPSSESGLLLVHISTSLCSGCSIQSGIISWLCGKLCLFYNEIDVRDVVSVVTLSLNVGYIHLHLMRFRM